MDGDRQVDTLLGYRHVSNLLAISAIVNVARLRYCNNKLVATTTATKSDCSTVTVLFIVESHAYLCSYL